MAFACYTFLYFALSGLLPIYLLDVLGADPGRLGPLTALAVLANAGGNIAAAALLARGVGTRALIFGGFAALAAVPVSVYEWRLPPFWAVAGLTGALAVGGLIPASLFATAPRAASPDRLPLTLGLLLQGSALGQFAGPPSLAAWADTFGWPFAPALLIPVALLGIVAMAGLDRSRTIRDT